MARLTIVWIIAVNALMCVLAKEKMYSNQYDDVDIEETLKNETLRDIYFYCFMEVIPCQTPQQKYLAGIFSEAYQTNCKKCTEKQKKMFEYVADYYLKNLPDRWEKVVAKTEEIFNRKKKAHHKLSALRW